jgi:hypothetical protein
MEQESDKQCSTCRHWDEFDHALGNCKFNPPVTITRVTTPDDADGVWPITFDGDWCSKHEMITTKKLLREINQP